MISSEQQILLLLLHRTRQRFTRHPGTERTGREFVRCKLCDNDWPASSFADYHATNCPVPQAEKLLLGEGLPESEVYQGLRAKETTGLEPPPPLRAGEYVTNAMTPRTLAPTSNIDTTKGTDTTKVDK